MPATNRIRIYDNTMIVDAQTCPRLFYLRHHEFLSEADKKVWFDFGGAWGKAMDAIWQHGCGKKVNINQLAKIGFDAFCQEWVDERGRPGPDDLTEDDLDVRSGGIGFRNPVVAHEMIYFYVEKRKPMFENRTIRLLSVEEPFAVPLHKADKTILYGGRWDKIIKIEGFVRCIEHKTTTAWQYPRKLKTEYLNSFSPNNQIDGYIYAGRFKYGKQFRGVYVDIALVHKDIHDLFELMPVSRDTGSIDAWLWDTWYWVNEIERNKAALKTVKSNDGYMAAFPKKTASCYRFPFNCQYLKICSTNSNPIGIKKDIPNDEHGRPMFKVEKWEPFDYLKMEKLGLRKRDLV